MREKELDVRGQECPKPVLATREALGDEGLEILRVVVDNRPSADNVARMAGSMGWKAEVAESADGFCVTVTRGEGAVGVSDAPEAALASCPTSAAAKRNVVVLVSSEFFGRGDDELGRILMRAFIKTLKEARPFPSTLVFANSGVRLTTEGTDLIDDIRALERSGATVLSCGTCLDFFGLKEKLLVGSVSNMFEIASVLVSATHVVRP